MKHPISINSRSHWLLFCVWWAINWGTGCSVVGPTGDDVWFSPSKSIVFHYDYYPLFPVVPACFSLLTARSLRLATIQLEKEAGDWKIVHRFSFRISRPVFSQLITRFLMNNQTRRRQSCRTCCRVLATGPRRAFHFSQRLFHLMASFGIPFTSRHKRVFDFSKLEMN